MVRTVPMSACPVKVGCVFVGVYRPSVRHRCGKCILRGAETENVRWWARFPAWLRRQQLSFSHNQRDALFDSLIEVHSATNRRSLLVISLARSRLRSCRRRDTQTNAYPLRFDAHLISIYRRKFLSILEKEDFSQKDHKNKFAPFPPVRWKRAFMNFHWIKMKLLRWGRIFWHFKLCKNESDMSNFRY